MEKQCFKCERVKPLTDFYRHGEMADGRLGKCKECTKNDVRANYRATIDAKRAYDRKRAMRPERVAARKIYQTRNPQIVQRGKSAWAARNPEKTRAQQAANNALRDRKIIKPPICEVCQRARPTQGHHEDYSLPFWLAWLCTTCHRNVHKGIVTLGRFHEARK